ncbi:MAG: cation-transporting P-type ATPase, partial [Terracidiphilus sp.]
MASPQPVRTAKTSSRDMATEPLDTLKQELGASPAGLNPAEAQARLEKYGYNELPEEKHNPLLKFLAYFLGP